MKISRRRLIVTGILMLLVTVGLCLLNTFPGGTRSTVGGDEASRISRPTSFERTAHGNHALSIAGRIFPVVFQDTTELVLSEAERLEIVADFQMVYGHLDISGNYDIPPRSMIVGGGETTVTKMAYATGSGQYFPKAHMNTFGLLSGDKDNYQLVIPLELITAYKNAFDLRKASQEAFDRFDKLLPPGNPAPLNTAGTDPADLVWTLSPSTLTPEMKERFVRGVSLAQFRRPSILEYFKSSGTHNTLGLSGLPDGTLCCIIREVQGNIPREAFVLVYIDGRWKIGIAPFGT